MGEPSSSVSGVRRPGVAMVMREDQADANRARAGRRTRSCPPRPRAPRRSSRRCCPGRSGRRPCGRPGAAGGRLASADIRGTSRSCGWRRGGSFALGHDREPTEVVRPTQALSVSLRGPWRKPRLHEHRLRAGRSDDRLAVDALESELLDRPRWTCSASAAKAHSRRGSPALARVAIPFPPRST